LTLPDGESADILDQNPSTLQLTERKLKDSSILARDDSKDYPKAKNPYLKSTTPLETFEVEDSKTKEKVSA
jgi:hypothetical protein